MPASLRWRWLALACALHALPAPAAFIEGDALLRERVMQPPDAVLVAAMEGPVTPDTADPCANAGTQPALGECSYEGFLKSSAALGAQSRQLESALKPGQRTTWRRVQKAWMTYRTQACHFESSQLATASARARAQWQCAARMTRERSAELARLTACKEGDTACPFHSLPDKKRLSIFSRRK